MYFIFKSVLAREEPLLVGSCMGKDLPTVRAALEMVKSPGEATSLNGRLQEHCLEGDLRGSF